MIERDYSFLLSRPEWTFEEGCIDVALDGKRVLITGAGGSIGSALAARVARSPASFLGLVGHSELPIFNLLSQLPPSSVFLDYAILDVGSDEMLDRVQRWKPDIIIHAAAHKHVGLIENQPAEAFRNNTKNTLYLANVAWAAGVKRFIFISTDKAVKPTTNMGASKRLAEAVLLTDDRADRVTVCRFGNVLGSSGSLVEILEQRKRAGKPFKLTSRDMRRFWITAKEATGLVLTSGLLLGAGLFTLEMGDSVPIEDTARKLDPNAAIEWGLPLPVEKSNEDLVGPEELRHPTEHPGIYKLTSPTLTHDRVFRELWDVFQDKTRLKDAAARL